LIRRFLRVSGPSFAEVPRERMALRRFFAAHGRESAIASGGGPPA
jgi:hypothetical protein